jgi:uncharacterized protein (DUF2267 family)
MNPTGVAAFDSTLQTTNIWLHDLMNIMGWRDKHRAYTALRSVLHALRDRLSVEHVAALGAQLPMLIRGIYYEGWHPHGKPVKERRREDFLYHVEKTFRDDLNVNAAEVTRAVFEVIAKHVTSGEVEHVKVTLPSEIRELWAPEFHTVWF